PFFAGYRHDRHGRRDALSRHRDLLAQGRAVEVRRIELGLQPAEPEVQWGYDLDQLVALGAADVVGLVPRETFGALPRSLAVDPGDLVEQIRNEAPLLIAAGRCGALGG